jgi:uncharacterized protein (DUF983 family)
VRCWLVCLQCGTKELLVPLTKFDGGCLHCGGGPRVAESDDGEPMIILSPEMGDLTSWDFQDAESK